MAAKPPLILACRNYDGTNAILRGLVESPGIELEAREVDNVAKMFTGMFQGEFDVSEMSLAELVYYASRDKAPFVGIPVFPSRVFRHRFLYYNRAAHIHGPQDLNGKRLGFVRWVQSAAIWIRGILTEEYGVAPERTEWFAASLHHWDHADHENDIRPRNGARIQKLAAGGGSEAERVGRALREGSVDAVGVTDPFLARDQDVFPLFPDYAAVEADYFKRTRIFPIMHVLTIQKQTLARDPELPQKLFALFAAAKTWAGKWQRATPSLGMAWTERHLEEEQEIFQGDPWAYGLQENRHVIDKFLTYCYAQGVSARELAAEELFVPASWNLHE